jgi:spermidine synthase
MALGWFEEKLYRDVRQSFAVSKILHRAQSEHQDVVVFENPVYGRVLALDGVVQVTQKDEYVYHEMMSHVPILAHGKAKDVLVVGGGDGGILREVLRHRSVKSATLVEIDRSVVDMCRKWMPSVSAGAFDDGRADIVIADGAAFVAKTDKRFDVIIVDSTDPIGPGEVLFAERFYKACKRCLKAGGILVNQNGVPFLQPGEIPMTARRRRKAFKVASFYMAAVPSYYGGLMALGWATDDAKAADVPLATLEKRFAAAHLKTHYYTPELHRASFALPAFVADLVP